MKNIYTYTKVTISECQACKNISIWLDEKMVYPKPKFALPPNEDLSEEIKKLYLEASEIVEQSPCGACAILRLALQKMLEELRLYKKDLNTIFAKNGKNIGILYEFVSKNLIYYYKNNKSKTPRKDEAKESGNDSDDGWNEDSDDDIYYEEEEEEYDDKCKTQ